MKNFKSNYFKILFILIICAGSFFLGSVCLLYSKQNNPEIIFSLSIYLMSENANTLRWLEHDRSDRIIKGAEIGICKAVLNILPIFDKIPDQSDDPLGFSKKTFLQNLVFAEDQLKQYGTKGKSDYANIALKQIQIAKEKCQIAIGVPVQRLPEAKSE